MKCLLDMYDQDNAAAHQSQLGSDMEKPSSVLPQAFLRFIVRIWKILMADYKQYVEYINCNHHPADIDNRTNVVQDCLENTSLLFASIQHQHLLDIKKTTFTVSLAYFILHQFTDQHFVRLLQFFHHCIIDNF